MGADAKGTEEAEAVNWDEDTIEAEDVSADAYDMKWCAGPLLPCDAGGAYGDTIPWDWYLCPPRES